MLDTILGRNPALRAAQSRAARELDASGITANLATAAGLVAGLLAGLCFGAGWRNSGILILGISAALDALDGTLAREHGSPTPLGGIFDLCADRLVEIAVLIGLVWPYPTLYFPALILAGSWYLNITVFLATGAATPAISQEPRSPEKLIAYPPGLVERTEAIIFFVILAITPRAGVVLCYGYAMLEIFTAVQRLRFARKVLAAVH
jgi:archaetidylinositol phosphate synthase